MTRVTIVADLMVTSKKELILVATRLLKDLSQVAWLEIRRQPMRLWSSYRDRSCARPTTTE